MIVKLVTVFAVLVVAGVAVPSMAAGEGDLTETELQYLADIAAHYEFDAEGINGLLETGAPLEDVPVALHVRKLDGTNPKTLLDVRSRGDSWLPILKNRSKLRADAFYFMIAAAIKSETYAPIFAKFKEVPEDRWGGIDLSDDEIVNLVNLRFVSSHHDYSVFEVMALRDQGKSFPEINNDVRIAKEKMIREQKEKLRKAQSSGDEGGW